MYTQPKTSPGKHQKPRGKQTEQTTEKKLSKTKRPTIKHNLQIAIRDTASKK
jgi:hypothetical protein